MLPPAPAVLLKSGLALPVLLQLSVQQLSTASVLAVRMCPCHCCCCCVPCCRGSKPGPWSSTAEKLRCIDADAPDAVGLC